MKAATRPLSRLLRDLFRLEPLEPRILLSADPVLGAAALVVAPPEEQAAALLQAYSAKADQVVATQPGDTVLVTHGPARNAQPGWLVVDVSQLAGGNGTLVIGGPDSNARILIGEEGGPDVALGNLVLLNPGAGGEVVMQSRLVVSGDLITVGSGHTKFVNADESASNFSVIDSVVVNGSRILTATDAAGHIQLGSSPGVFSVNGNEDATPDTLTLRADGDVSIYNRFAGSDLLEGLTIEARTDGGTDLPSSVIFYDTVSLNGDLVIEVESTGTVTFDKLVTINANGNVHISGAGAVRFLGGLTMNGTGNVFIEGNEIDFGTSTESIRGAGVLTLRPATVGNGIEIGLGSGGSTLDLVATDLAALADGFSKIVIGHESVGHAAAGAGAVRVGAGVAPNPLLRDPVEIYGGTVTVEDPASSLDQMIVNGTIKLDAVNDIVIKGAMIARGASGSGTSDITLYSESGSVTQVDSLDDNLTASEPLRGALLTVRAATGISLPFTELGSVSATNATSGGLSITETATGTDLTVVLLSQAAASANIDLRTTSGNLTLNGDVNNAGSGSTLLQARGTSKQITVNDSIYSALGTITLTATGQVTTAVGGTVTTDGAADVSLTSSNAGIQQGADIVSAGGLVALQAATAIAMGDGTLLQSLNTTGRASLVATAGNVTLSRVAAASTIGVTAGSAILDGLTGANPNLDGETAAVLLAAASGIGTGSAAIQTRVQSLGAGNTGSGGVFVREATALTLTSTGTYAVDAGGTGGAISVVTTEGTLTVSKAVRSTGAAGHILLQAGETAELTAADLAVNAAVSSTSGSISLVAADNLTIASGTTVSTAGNATQFVDVRADGSITMAATSQLAAANGGTIWVEAGAGEVLLGTVNAGAGKAFVTAATNVLDAQSDDATPGVNITASQARLAAGGSIGAAGALLETSVATLAADAAGGGLFVSEADALSIGTVGTAGSSRVAADGTIAAAAGAADLAGLDIAGALVLQAGGNLTVSQAVQAAGNLRLNTSGTLDTSVAVTSTGGHLSVVAAGQLNAASTALFETQTAGRTLDLASTGAAVVMSDGAQARTNAGALRVQAGLAATLGRIDARSAADRAGDSLAGQAGWGSVSVVAGGAINGNSSQSTPDVFANQLRLQGSGIGTDPVNLQAEAALLSASAGAGGLFVQEATALQLGTTADLSVNRVGVDGGAGTAQTDAGLAGVTSLGILVLRTTAGGLGGDATGAVSGTGNVLLQAGGATSNLDLDGNVSSSAGHLSLDAGQDLLLDGNVSTSGSGKTIDLLAARHVTLAQGRSVASTNGHVAIQGAGTITIEQVSAGTGNVRLAGAAIVDGDAAGDTEADLLAAGALLKATTGAIGAAGAQLETTVGTLTAQAGAGVYLLESNGVTIGSLQVNVERVAAGGGSAATAHAAQEDLGGTSVLLTSTTGNLVVQAGTAGSAGVTSTAGAVRLQAAGGGLQVEASVDAGTSSLSLIGATAATLGVVDAIVLSGGTVDLEASAGSLTLAANAVVRTDGGNIRARAQGDLLFSVLDARTAADRIADSLAGQGAWGSVSVLAGGAISDYAGDTAVNVYANALRLQAGGGLGTGAQPVETEAALLSASAGTDGMFLRESSALTVGTTPAIGVARPSADGTSTATVTDGAQIGLASGGALVLTTVNGALTLAATGTATAASHLLLSAGGATSDLTVGAQVQSNDGHVAVYAGRHLALDANVHAMGAGDTIDLWAGGNLAQAQGTSVSTSNGNLAAVAGGTLTVESMVAGTAGLHASAAAIVDGDAAGDTESDFAAGSLRLLSTGAIGASGNAIETEAGLLAARATGQVFVSEADALTVGTMGVVQVQQVGSAGTTTGFNHTGDSGLAGTDIVVRALNGSFTLSGTGAVSATGNLLLQAGGAGSDLSTGAGVTASGSISLLATDAVTVSAAVSATGAGATLDVQGASIDALEGSSLATNNGNVLLSAIGTVTLESISAGTGAVRIAANRVVDGDASSDSEVDITAAQLAINAGERIGLGANALETAVGTASLRASTNLFVTETDALTLDTVTVGVNRVGADGAAAAQAAVAQSNNTGAAFVLQTLNGTLTSTALGGAVTAAGNVLLRAGGTGSDIVLGGAVSSSAGHISLDAADALQQNANITATQNSATVDLLAGGALTQADGTSVSTNNGHVALQAGAAVTLELVSAGVGRVSIAGTAIVDGDADGDSDADVLANGVKLTASNGSIGTGANAIEVTTSSLSAVAGNGGSVYLTESDAVNLDSVAVTVQRVGTASTVTAQSGTQATLSGATVVVRTLGGSLTSLATNGAVTAAGNLLLQAGGATSDLVVGAAVTTSSGALSLAAGRDLTLNAGVSNTGAGTMDLVAAGAFLQAQGTTVTTAGGHLALQAGGAATIESLNAGAGNLRVSAGGISDGDAAGDTEVDLLAAGAKLVSTGAIGASGAEIETTVAVLAAQVTGHVFITETNALQVGTLAVAVDRVAADGTVTTPADAATSGLSGQNVVLRTLDGALETLGLAAVNATGTLLLAAGGAAGDLTAGASITAAGPLSLAAGRDMSLASTVSTTTAGSTIDLVAQGALTAQQGSAIAANNANVLLQAGGNVTIESVAAGTGAIRLAGADIVDGDTTASETEVDVTGAQLQITATGAVGSTTNALETTIATLSISAGGSITLAESDALAIDSTSVSVNRVGTNGATIATTAVVQSDVTSAGGSITLVAQGAVDLPAGADVRTTGAATITITSVTGAVLMQAADPGQSVIETGSGDIRVNAEGDIRPGALLTTGHAYLDSANGSILIAGDLQRDEDINLVGDDLVITVPVSSPGVLTIGPLTTGTTVVVGNVAPAGVLQVDTNELGLLQDGFTRIVIGSSLANQSVQLEGNGLGNALVFTDPLVLTASGVGGNISISGALQGDTLTVQDTGTATNLAGATVQMQGNLAVQDEVTVNGASSLTSTGGSVQFTKAVTGGGGTDDTLTLSAQGGNVSFDGQVSNLDGMTITDAVDVSFGADVDITGVLEIVATGTVTFSGQLGMGGQLIVRGGAQVLFGVGGANLAGGASLQVRDLQAGGTITGGGVLEVSGSTTATALHLGSGAGAVGALAIDGATLANIGTGFTTVQFGSAGAGAGTVSIGDANLTATDAGIRILGSAITVSAGGTGLRVDTDLSLQATGNITMAGGSDILNEGREIELAAGGALAVAGLDARAAGGGAGSVKLTGTTITDANGDTAIDVYAQAVDFVGIGPAMGAGNVLEVAAPIVRVDPGAGLVLRESGSDNRTYYNVLRGGALTQALVAVGPSVRVTSDPDNFVGDPDLLQDMGLTLPLAPSGFQSSQLSAVSPGAVGTYGGTAAAGAGAAATQVGSYLVSGASMVAPELSLSERLLADSGMAFASGQPADVQSSIDWWLESVEL